MKSRLLAILLILLLLLSCGCNKETEDLLFNPNVTTGPPNRPIGNFEPELWMGEEGVYFNCSHGGTKSIMYASFTGQGTPTLIAEGLEMTDLFGSLMVYRDWKNKASYLQDLNTGAKAPLALDSIDASLRLEDTLYLFGQEDEKFACYTVELATLEISAQKCPRKIEWIAMDDRSVFYIYAEGENDVLVEYDRATKQEKELWRNTGIGLDYDATRLIYWYGTDGPYLYDRQTGEQRRVFTDPYGTPQRLLGDIIWRRVDTGDGMPRYATYDLSKDAEVPMGDLGLANDTFYYSFFKGGYIYYDTYPLQTLTVYKDGEQRTVTVNEQFIKDAVLNAKVNDQGIAFITESELYTATWEDPVLKKYDHSR